MSWYHWRKKTLFFMLLFYPTLLLLGGCWDRTELNDLALILASGIDKGKKNNVELTVQVFIPKPSSSGQQGGMSSGGSSGQTLVRSAEGVTLADAMSRLQEKLTRRIFWGQNEVLIVGEKLAKKGLSEHIDFWMRNTEPRERADIFVSKGKAKNILESMPELERDTAKQLHELVKTKIGVKVTVKELAEMLSGESGAAVIPWVEKLPQESLSLNKKQEIPFIVGAAVFKGDKMVGRLNEKVTRGILWPRNEMKSGIITVSLKDKKGFMSLHLLRSHSQLIPTIKNGKWSILVRSVTDLELIQNTTNFNLLNPKINKEVEYRVVQGIEERERLALSEVQKKMNADIFGFAETFQREYPRIWVRKRKEWNEVFPSVDVKFSTKVTIKRTGLATQEKK